MPASHRKFGELLEEGIKRVHINRKKPIGLILDEFGYELRPDDSSKGRYAIGHWYYKKRIPAEMEDVAKLAQLIITNSDLERDWLEAFLQSAGYPKPESLVNQYFVQTVNPQSTVEATPELVATPIREVATPAPTEIVEPRSQFSWIALMVVVIAFGALGTFALFSNRGQVEVLPTATTAPTLVQEVSPSETSTAVVVVTETRVAPTQIPFTPTLDFATWDGTCPQVVAVSKFEYASNESFREFLNAGASPAILQSAFNELVQKQGAIRDGRVAVVDLTGDGVPEVLIDAVSGQGSFWQILACDHGEYEPLVSQESEATLGLRFTVDLNGNQLPEILGYRQTQQGDTPYFEFFLQQWNGHAIVDMRDRTRFDAIGKRLPTDITDWQPEIANASVTTQDTNRDGLFEMVIKGGIITPVPTCETRFEREFTEVWGWNGSAFQFLSRSYVPPIYRFQRVADGDLAFALGDLDTALLAYQDVLFDANLFDRNQYLTHLEFCKGLATDEPQIQHERQQLEAYARWRILLINTINDARDAQKIVYQNLQTKFPADTPGHHYAEIARAFWEEYQTLQDLVPACERANAVARSDALYPAQRAENICFVP